MSEQLDESTRAAFSSSTRLQILQLCEEAPQTSRTLVAHLGVARGVVNRHLAALEDAELIEEVDRQSVHGGSLVSYRAATPGWSAAIEQLNTLTRNSRRG